MKDAREGRRTPRATGVVCAPWRVPALVAVFLAGFAAPAPGAGDPVRFAIPPPSPRLVVPKKGVLFVDDFSSDSLRHWVADREGVWSIYRGMLRGDLPDRKQERSIIYAGEPGWTDYAVDLDVCMMRGVDKGVIVRAAENAGVGVDMRGPGYQDIVLQQGWRPLGRKTLVNGNGIWHHMRVEARGHRYRVFVNGDKVLDEKDSRKTSAAGRIGLPAYTGGGGQCTVYYDNVVVVALH